MSGESRNHKATARVPIGPETFGRKKFGTERLRRQPPVAIVARDEDCVPFSQFRNGGECLIGGDDTGDDTDPVALHHFLRLTHAGGRVAAGVFDDQLDLPSAQQPALGVDLLRPELAGPAHLRADAAGRPGHGNWQPDFDRVRRGGRALDPRHRRQSGGLQDGTARDPKGDGMVILPEVTFAWTLLGGRYGESGDPGNGGARKLLRGVRPQVVVDAMVAGHPPSQFAVRIRLANRRDLRCIRRINGELHDEAVGRGAGTSICSSHDPSPAAGYPRSPRERPIR